MLRIVALLVALQTSQGLQSCCTRLGQSRVAATFATPARGAAAKPKIENTHANAENNYAHNLLTKVESASKHNVKVDSVAVGSRWADKLVAAERKLNADIDMAAHAVMQTVQHRHGMASPKQTKQMIE